MAQRYRKIMVDGRTVALHRYVYEQVHGPIPPGMYVHHVNGDPFDNRIENLALMTPAEHSRHHNDRYPRVKVCEVCGVRYEPPPSKRKRSRTCSRPCKRALQSRLAFEREARRRAQAVAPGSTLRDPQPT